MVFFPAHLQIKAQSLLFLVVKLVFYENKNCFSEIHLCAVCWHGGRCRKHDATQRSVCQQGEYAWIQFHDVGARIVCDNPHIAYHIVCKCLFYHLRVNVIEKCGKLKAYGRLKNYRARHPPSPLTEITSLGFDQPSNVPSVV